MPALDRSYVVSESEVVPCARATFLAAHLTLHGWRRYAPVAAFGVITAVVVGSAPLLVVAPGGVVVVAIALYRRILHDVRTEVPVGTVVALGFGTNSFAFQTWLEGREIPYSAITRVVRSHGCVVICALSYRVFWALPERMVPVEVVGWMRAATPEGHH